MHKYLAVALALTVGACAHNQAVRVNCDGRLRPINIPASSVPEGKDPTAAKDADTGSGSTSSESSQHER